MRAKRIEGDKKGTGTRKEQMGEGNRKEPEARGLDQEDVRPGRSGEAQAKAGGPGPAHAQGHFLLLARVVPQFAQPAGEWPAALTEAGHVENAVVILVLPGAVVQ